MSLATRVTALLNLETGLSVNQAILDDATAQLRSIIGADYDEVYQNSITISSVTDSSGAVFWASDDHLLVTGDPKRGRITTTGFDTAAYNGTFNVFATSDTSFKLLKLKSDDVVTFVIDDNGTAKHWRFNDYEAAEARLACALVAMGLKKHHKDEIFFSDKGTGEQFGKGQRQPAQMGEFLMNEAYHKRQAGEILYSLGYSVGVRLR